MLKDNIVKDKIIFKEQTFYPVDIPPMFSACVLEGADVDAGQIICERVTKRTTQSVTYKGKAVVGEGDRVSEGDVIAEKSRFRKQETKSPVSGVVKRVTDAEIVILVGGVERKEFDDVRSPFDARVSGIVKDKILLEFSGVQINLLASKGDPSTGTIKYIPSQILRNQKKRPQNLEGSIVITDQLTSELYPLMSTLGVVGVIANGIDYYLYRDIIILAVPVGIINGFGSIGEDKRIVKYLIDKDNQTAWFDTEFSRLVIPEQKEPAWVANHELNLEGIGVV